MFSNTLKSFLLKKNLKRQLFNVKEESLSCPVVKIGLIVDESNFVKTDELKQEIISNGIADGNIKIIAYRDVLDPKKVYQHSTFGLKDINLKGKFTDKILNEFISEEFDLLINYYNENKPFLLFLTQNSKAKFKVGFSNVDKRLNHLLINIALEDYKGFSHELFRYLKILNKI